MLLSCWPIIILANLYFIVKITHLMDAGAGRTGAKRVRNARRGLGMAADGGGAAGLGSWGSAGSCPKGISGRALFGLALKMASFGNSVHEVF
jgi:hypothetical protein